MFENVFTVLLNYDVEMLTHSAISFKGKKKGLWKNLKIL